MNTGVMRPIVMCKAPVAGRVKTRLEPVYGKEGAAALHAVMATLVIERALRLFPNTWIAADDVNHSFFAAFPAAVLPQGMGDLGERMQRLVRRALDFGAESVLLLGSDSPHMSEARLLSAQQALKACDVVVGPVQDGGYDLLGVRRCWPELFKQINWGSRVVLMQTLQRVSTLGLTHRCLSFGFDVDEPEDVERARHSMPGFDGLCSQLPNMRL
jgi:uncharacterized protein